jgi:hypothetical protein
MAVPVPGVPAGPSVVRSPPPAASAPGVRRPVVRSLHAAPPPFATTPEMAHRALSAQPYRPPARRPRRPTRFEDRERPTARSKLALGPGANRCRCPARYSTKSTERSTRCPPRSCLDLNREVLSEAHEGRPVRGFAASRTWQPASEAAVRARRPRYCHAAHWAVLTPGGCPTPLHRARQPPRVASRCVQSTSRLRYAAPALPPVSWRGRLAALRRPAQLAQRRSGGVMAMPRNVPALVIA